MEKLQSLIQDILDSTSIHESITIWFSGITTRDIVERRTSSTGATHINIYVEDGVSISIYHKKNTAVSFGVPMEKLGYDFTEAIEHAAKLWNEYKSNNL